MGLRRIAIAIGLAVLAVQAVELDERCREATFDSVLGEKATLEKVASVSKGDEYGEGDENLAYPINPKRLPELCAVTVEVESSSRSSFRFGLFLPTEWNSKFLAVGNGGFAGGINWLDMGPGAHYGFATVSTDTGHSSNVTDLSWALRNEDRRVDWGWRALHGSVELSKKLVAAYYEEDAEYSFYSGCSTGGRQGLKEIQKFPDTFDGAMIGAPAWNPTILNPYVTQMGIYNLPAEDDKHIERDMLPVLAAEVVKQCDTADGVEDGIVSAPDDCKVDLSALSCDRQGINQSACLTDSQTDTINKLYTDLHSKDGDFLYSAFEPGSEAQWTSVIGSETPSPFGVGFQRYFVYDEPDWSWKKFNLTVFEDTQKRNPGESRADKYDLSAFRDRGGKIVMYHGMADGLVPRRGSNLYYNRVTNAMGGMPSDFFRYFMVPGMQHCWTTAVDAPWYFAGAFQAGSVGNDTWSVPGFRDARHDMLLALVNWVEKDEPVDSVIATVWKEDMWDDEEERDVDELDDASRAQVLRQRPLCPYPQQAVYDGEGDVDQAGSWECKVEEEGLVGRNLPSGLLVGVVVLFVSTVFCL